MELSAFLGVLGAKTGFTPRPTGTGYEARCPAHEDKNPSLSISEGQNSRILVKCHAGCSFETVVEALGLSAADLAPSAATPEAQRRGRPRKSFNIVARYPYHDREGKVLFEVCRMDPKDFRQRRPDATSPDGWAWNLRGVQQVPYRLPALLATVRVGETVFIAEGEKDVEALAKHGFAATCNPGGAGKWRGEFGEYFDGAKAVVVIADKDTPGRAHAAAVAARLKLLVRSVKVIELPDIEAHPVKDAADFFAAGGTAEALRRMASEAAEYVPVEELTPTTWFKQQFPKLAERHGEPVLQRVAENRASVTDVSDDFMAATLGTEGQPDAPTVYLPLEDRFYTYNPAAGIFERQREDDLEARLSGMFLRAGRACEGSANVSRLLFRMRSSATLAGIVRRAKAVLAVPDDFFALGQADVLPVANGMLRLSDRRRLPFSPSYRCRHKLAVDYVPDAYCPLFMDTLLKPALNPADVCLVQRWAGLALVGVNHSQKIMLLTGTPGGGKSTLVSVLVHIIGTKNVGTLRTDLLTDRFEVGRMIGKTLLYGADVPEDFLTKRTASALKSLTGGDVMTAEFKNSNESPQIRCQFNVVVTSNSRLTLRLEGDSEAWRRRLAIVAYNRPKPEAAIANLADRIVSEEGPGVLNFMLDGLDALRKAEWQLRLNGDQQRRVDDLLLESDSHRVFVEECLVKDTQSPGMTKAEAHAAYVDFCDGRGWLAMPRNRFGVLVAECIQRAFNLGVRGDVVGVDGKQKDGWKYLRPKKEGEEYP